MTSVSAGFLYAANTFQTEATVESFVTGLDLDTVQEQPPHGKAILESLSREQLSVVLGVLEPHHRRAVQNALKLSRTNDLLEGQLDSNKQQTAETTNLSFELRRLLIQLAFKNTPVGKRLPFEPHVGKIGAAALGAVAKLMDRRHAIRLRKLIDEDNIEHYQFGVSNPPQPDVLQLIHESVAGLASDANVCGAVGTYIGCYVVAELTTVTELEPIDGRSLEQVAGLHSRAKKSSKRHLVPKLTQFLESILEHQ